ncbi:MAG: phosphodiesterase [Planctomycetota bacterium]|nr:MAG: phosphodiesterase [Planctomycetota bacterium]
MDALHHAFDALHALLESADSVVIAGHEHADGDAVGAVAALRRHLELLDKRVTVLLDEPLNPRYGFMQFRKHYEVYDPALHDELLRSADAFVMCDLSSRARLGPLGVPAFEGRATTVCIDHHPCDDGGPAEVNVLDATATATGELVHRYITHVGGNIDRQIAESVFVSLCTDTGWFRYPNTTPDVIQLAADLAKQRLDLPGMYRSIYQSNSAAMLRVLGHVARSMTEECDGRMVWAWVRRDLLDELGVERYEADPILDVLRSGELVETVALFTEQSDGRVAVSLRSRGRPDVNGVARAFGGGGHAFAAGTTLSAATAQEDRRKLVSSLRTATAEAFA